MEGLKNEECIVSIIMPAYNCAKYIEEAITSVINQTYDLWELIIIDDGSRDNTVNIIKTLAKKDSRIRFFKNESNEGVSSTRNRGIRLAEGEWIAFLDSDDMWEKTKLSKQLSYAMKSSAEFVFTGASYINECGIFYNGVFQVPEKISYKELVNHNVISCSSVIIKKRLFENIKMERDDLHEDYAVWLKILKPGTIAHGINKQLLIYRISKSSKSGNKLKTFKMTYNVYRFLGINAFKSVYFTARHILGSIKKYRIIYQ